MAANCAAKERDIRRIYLKSDTVNFLCLYLFEKLSELIFSKGAEGLIIGTESCF